MPELWSESPEMRLIRWLLMVYFFSAVLWWSGPEAEKVVAVKISVNKAKVGGDPTLSAGGCLLLPSGRHGGGTRRQAAAAGGEAGNLRGIYGAATSWRSTSVVLSWPPTHEAVGRLLLFRTRWRQSFNLLRRPLRGFTVALLFPQRSSGVVPDP
jgi:hypothetical protein